MKKIFHVLFSMVMILSLNITSQGQRDVQKTTEVLGLHADFAKTDGIITKIETSSIVCERTIDMTRRPADTTEVYKIVKNVPQTTSFYSLNYWDGRIDATIKRTSSNTFERDWFTSSTGAWQAAIKYEISLDGKTVTETRSVGQNVIVNRVRQGFSWVQSPIQTDFNNPPVRVTVVTFIKDSRRTQEVRTRTNENHNLFRILSSLSWSRDQLEDALKITYTIESKAANFIHSSCTEATGNAQTGYWIQPYYDGINLYSQKPSGRITSYNKPWPGVKLRWIIYNGQNIHVATGANQVIQYETIEEQSTKGPLKFVAGTKYAYDASTHTVTYNSSIPCEVWAVTEENPAQYKQWQTESIYIVHNGELVKK